MNLSSDLPNDNVQQQVTDASPYLVCISPTSHARSMEELFLFEVLRHSDCASQFPFLYGDVQEFIFYSTLDIGGVSQYSMNSPAFIATS